MKIYSILMLSLLASLQCQAKDNSISDHQSVKDFCSSTLKSKQYVILENYLSANDNNENLRDKNGWYLAPLCMNGLVNKESQEEIEEWLKHSPKNIYPHIAKQYNLVERFFKIRGNKFIHEIPPEQLMKAVNLLEDGAKELDKSKKIGATPLWYQTRINIGFYQIDRKYYFNELQEGSKKYPDYFPINTMASYFMVPKWGFPYEFLEGFANYQSDNSSLKDEMYARIYDAVVTPCCSQEITNAGYFDKDRFSRGVTAILKKYPTDYNYNNFANAACLLQADDAVKSIFVKMSEYMPSLWYQGVYNQCLQRLSQN